MPNTLKVDVWSDVACPWCYIGKRRLEAGIAAFTDAADGTAVSVEYHSFLLMPDAPDDIAASAVQFLAQRYGVSESQAGQMQDRVASIAATVGLEYDFASQQMANTLAAHQLLHLAKASGRQADVKERLLAAHFVEGRHVGRHDVLADLASDAGLDRHEVVRALKEQTYLPAVRDDERRARDLGISGVPFFVIDGRYGISGAQPSELFTRALRQASADLGDGPAARRAAAR